MTSPEEWAAVDAEQRPRLVVYAAMLLGSTAAAEDVVADSIAKLIASTHLEIDNPAAYLRTTVLNRCRKELRRRGRLRPLRPDDLEPYLDPPHLELLDAVARLTPRRRMAVLLRYYLDLPVNEIAQSMGCAPSTVSSLLHRALRDLEEVLS